ncbi:von Willebrand factor D and EGF domain-containing protein-like, partial [Actinia tenebrosa]|uniref:von Willebrand factor D and EGF domain-containing protein-like n=1 Tax=Actinia tenebrosa TaxID=6105 RepID=A0A6P8IV94_ACTTE
MMDAYLNLTLLLVSVFLMATGIDCSDPCGKAREIHNPFRSASYKLKKGEKALCDRKLSEGWYKFKDGLQIPISKPAPLHCGTFAPIWMRGSLPTTIGNTVKAEACVNLFNIRKGCSTTLPLSVRLCEGNVYVYHLTPPRGCAMAYCAGDRKPCPRGKEGTPPNCKISNINVFPESLVPLPTITYGGSSVLQMVCSFKFPAWNNVSYLVEWYANSFTSPVLLDSWCERDDDNCTQRQSSIKVGKDGHFAVGDTVSCRLKMKYSTSSMNEWTEFGKDSKQYYVGIEVSPRHIFVKECKGDRNATVTLRPTVPFLPARFGLDSVTVSILIPEKYKAQKQQAAVDKCSVDLTTQDMTKGQSIAISGICDNLNEDRQSYLFHFRPATSNPFWNSVAYRMPSLKVSVDNINTNSCRSTSDPYLHTFAGRRFSYNEAGDFLMYKNSALKVEVHVRSWTCHKSGATCVCGVAIREGKDVIELSICNQVLNNENKEPTKLFVRKKSPGRLANGIQVNENLKGQSLEHEVILSSGTRVKVYRYVITLDVYVFAPNTDGVSTDGLCGKINGIRSDIFKYGRNGQSYTNQEDFSHSWLLKPEESYLEKNLPIDEKEPEQERFCFCSITDDKFTSNTCKTSANHFNDIEEGGREVQLNIDPTMFELKRRSVDSHWYSDDIINQEYRSFFVADHDVQKALNRIRSKRSTSYTRWPERRAKRYCTKLIEGSEAAKTCRKLDSESVESAIGQCINDLVLSGNEDFAILAFDTMKVVCEETALTNLSLYTQNSDGELIFSKEIVQDLCPTNCSGRGECKNRTCICDEGYTARDCSIDVNAVPELLGIYNGGLCDIRERPCKKTDLLGQKFIDSNNLTCHVKEFKVYSGSWSPRGIPITTHGKMMDIFGVKCNLPDPPTRLGDYDHEGTPAGGLMISVSNDGFNASAQQLRHVTYDSKCMNCTNSSICERKPNSCLIRGHCFAANEPNPRDWCQQCLPKDDQNSWTRRKNNQAPNFATKTAVLAVQGEDLVIQLKATDPDNRPVTFSLLSSTATGHTLSTAGLLRWKVTSNEKFTFKVTDECGAFDTTDMLVRIVQCPCLNDGQCVPHPYHPRGSGLYQCKCVNGFSGDRCQRCPGLVCPPRNLSVMKLSSTEVEVKWLEPQDKSVEYYLLGYGPLEQNPSIRSLSKNITSWILTNLRKFTDYRIAVSVVNENRTMTVEIIVKTDEDVPDASPNITNITPVSCDTINITWSPISKTLRNGIIRGYRIYYKAGLANGSWAKWQSLTVRTGNVSSVNVTKAVVSRLKPTTMYCFKMTAFTSKGEFPLLKVSNCWLAKINRAPQFSLKPMIYNALQGEDLVIQLKATDPDNRPITYSLLSSTAIGHTFSPAGLLRWKVTS